MCTLAVCGLAHYFEAAGIPTVALALIPQHARQVAPPRVLAVPFILGRPLGVPNDSAFQHRVLDAALALLVRTDGPVFEIYEEEAVSTAAEDPWVCPVTFDTVTGETTLLEGVVAEMNLLSPWYEKGCAQRGFSTVGTSGMTAQEAARYLDQYATGEVSAEALRPELIKHAAEDLKAFYNEAAISQPGAASAEDIENWYWQDCRAGQLVKQVSARFMNSSERLMKLTARLLLVPESQR